MLISLTGPACSGKKTIAEYLCTHHGFELVKIVPGEGAAPPTSDMASEELDANGQPAPRTFPSPKALLEYSTANWRQSLVTVDLTSLEEINIGFDMRPWFLLVYVEAPLSARWMRANKLRSKDGIHAAAAISLEDFVAADDRAMYGTSVLGGSSVNGASQSSSSSSPVNGSIPALSHQRPTSTSSPGVSTLHLGLGDLALQGLPIKSPPLNSSGSLYPILLQAHLRILNPYGTTTELYRYLSTLSLPSPHRLRPTWETYFLSLCTLASLRSNCMKRRVGAVLVRNNRVLSTGYNGTPRGLANCNEGGCPRCNGSAKRGAQLDECFCLHAEENALLECGRERGGAEGTVLYCNTCPCLRCAVKIVQTGVKEVVYQLDYSVDHRSCDIFEAAGVIFRKYDSG